MSSVQKFFSDEEEHEETEDDEVMEVEEEGIEMKWSLAKYLPEAASCQEIFLVIIAGHIKELYTHLMEQQQSHLSGGTPVRRRTGSSQTQVSTCTGERGEDRGRACVREGEIERDGY